MSSPPVKYSRYADFSDFSSLHPGEQQPGVNLDGEFDRIKLTTDATIDRLSLIQRDDGALRNQIVTPDSLSQVTLALISAVGINPRGNWATTTFYAAKDLVLQNGSAYMVVTAHTSGVFATDLAASKLMLFASTTDISSVVADLLNYAPVSAVVAAPTGAEADGVRYIVKGGTGTFAGKSGLIAQKVSGTWAFGAVPKQGQRVWVDSYGMFFAYRNTWWNRIKQGVTGYQHFEDLPVGTIANGLVIGTGQTLVAGGAGGATGAGDGLRYVPTDNTYIVAPMHGKNVRWGMTVEWRAGHAGVGSAVLAAGVTVGGAIITKMAAHCENQYASPPVVSIWGGPRRTSIAGVPQAYLNQDEFQYPTYSTIDTNQPVHIMGQKSKVEAVVSGNVIRAFADSAHWANSYNDNMVSALLGDNDAGDTGYLYFQSGPTSSAFLPYIYEIWWEELTGPLEVLPDPKSIPTPGTVPIVKALSLPFGVATEIFRYTPGAGAANAMFVIEIGIVAMGAIAGYAGTIQGWRLGGGNFSGTITAPAPVQTIGDLSVSLGGPTVTLSGVLSQVIAGADVIIKFTPSRTGTDATAYTPTVTASLRSLANPVVVT